MKKNILLTLMALMCAIYAQAYDFMSSDLYYNITSSTKPYTVEVTYQYKYSGNYERLTSITIPATVTYNGKTYSVTSIEEYAFGSCTGLKSVTIGNSVTSIGSHAFSDCTGLTSITIPNSVTSIGDFVFDNCTGLTSVVWNAKKCGGWSYSYYSSPFYSVSDSITSFTFGDEVETIPAYLCYGMRKLTSITIPNSVTSIGESAFQYCKGLTSVTIGNSVTSTGKSAFYNCTGLTSVVWNAKQCAGYWGEKEYFRDSKENITSFTFGNEVESIPDYLCYGMSKLTAITIPNSVTSIGDEAFSWCTRLTSVTIGNSVTSIGDEAFSWCTRLTSVTIGNSVTSIGDEAFSWCTRLTSVTIGNSVTSIGKSAFQSCTGLTSVTIGNSVTSIGEYTFNFCESLTSVTIPNSVTSIGSYAFRECTGLTSVTIGTGVISIGEETFKFCKGITSITIPNSVTSIGNNAFSGCTGLTSITIPESVTSIESGTFSGCTSLESITIPNSVTSIGKSAFQSCTGLTSVTIGTGVISIGEHAFRYCTGLTSITIPNSVTSIGSYAFHECTGLTSVTIGTGVISIGDYAFYRCTGLTSVAIPNSVTSIGDDAFYECYLLTSVTIGNSVTSIGSFAFYACSLLASVTIGNSVTSIGSAAFSWCTRLTSIRLKAQTPPQCMGDPFYKVPKDIPVYVPCGTKEAYQAADTWSSFTNFIEMPPHVLTVTAQDDTMGSVRVNQEATCIDNKAIFEAIADEHYHFVQWSDGNTDNPRTVSVDGDATYMAVFAPNQYTISATATNGRVEGAGKYDYGTAATLTAIANEHYHFTQWSDGNTTNPRKVTVESDATYTAVFAPNKYTLSATGKNGYVEGAGKYDYGTTATLTAKADEHYHFVQWSDGNTDNPRTVAVEDNATYTAEFAIDQHTITATCDPQQGTVTGAGTYDYGTQVTLVATANKGYEFAQWSNGVTDNPYILTATEDLTLEAQFVPATAVENVPSDGDTTVRKVFRDGQVYILRNGKTYTTTGVEVE